MSGNEHMSNRFPLGDRVNSNQLVQNNNQNPHNIPNMDPDLIDFEECLKDSPKFRQSLKENLNYIEHLENSMTKTIKQISNYIDSGREHIKSQKDLISSLSSLNNALGPGQRETTKKIGDLLEVLQEISRQHEIVIDQSGRTIGSSLTKFVSDDLIKLRDARKSFDKISHEHDQALLKYSQPLKKQQEDSENFLIATSTAFTHTSLDLSIQVTALQCKKGHEILGSILSFTRAFSTYFHQGYDLFEDIKPHMGDMDEYLLKIQDGFEVTTRNLPSKHLMVSNNELKPLCFDQKAQQVHLEGYLFKRASNGFKIWNRRWFILKDHQLLYMKRGDIQPITMEQDLRLLTVRPVDKADTERRFCFEIVSPHKSHILQADSESACKTWIQAIQAGINAAFHDNDSDRLPSPRQVSSSMRDITNSNENTQSASSVPRHNGQAASSWSSNFSLKALQQQASSKLSSFTGVGDTKDHHQHKLKRAAHTTHDRYEDDGPGLDGADDHDDELVVDELGRSYALLRHDDNDDDEEDGDERQVAKYPAPASGKNYSPKHPSMAGAKNNGSIVHNSITDNRVDAIASTTGAAPSNPPEKPQRAYMIILGMQGNDACADCSAPQPRWASINLGITLCIECAGIHRSLGVHLSKVRSLTLDTEVWSPEIVQFMLSLGNIKVNSNYLAEYQNQIPQIGPDSSREERENWIKAKYLLRKFTRPNEQQDAVSSDVIAGSKVDSSNSNDTDSCINLTGSPSEI